MTTAEKFMLARAITSIDYAYKKALEGLQKPQRVSWDMLLGEFAVYSGIAYNAHPANRTASGIERKAARQLMLSLYSFRYGYWGKPKAVRLRDLRQLIQNPRRELYLKGLEKATLRYLDRILRGYGLETILGSKSYHLATP